MTYDNWKTTNRDDEQLGPQPDEEPAGSRLLLEPVEPELNQADWYRDVWLPNAQKALRGERVDPVLLNGDDGQADEQADAERGWWGD